MPWRKLRVRVSSAKWINNEYLSMVDRREYLAKQHKHCPCDYHLLLKLSARRECNRLRNQLKRDYIRTTLERHKHNPKKVWQTIKEFWPSGSKNYSIKKIGQSCDNYTMSNIMNDHFSTIAAKTLDTGNFTEDIGDYLPPLHAPSFSFIEITTKDVADAINKLSSSKACSHDGITAFMIKCAKTELLPILTYLFNRSLSLKVFPKLWKDAIVTPLFKSGRQDDVGNYRPISVLSTVGKLLERCVHDQCYQYLSTHNLLTTSQSGFRKAHSTTTCLADFLDNIYQEIDEGVACGAIYLDLSKAFDTVDHHILLLKLRYLGFQHGVISWFRSNLSNRMQCTKVNGVLSDKAQMNSGVPQGSILGPLLFICYINDLPCHLTDSATFIYADDTAILVKGKSVDQIDNMLNSEFKKVTNWFNANRLSVNRKKTNVMLFCGSRSKHRNSKLNIRLNADDDEEVLDQVPHAKYLGVELDEHLSFENHVNKLCSKVSARTGILWRMRSFISEGLAKELYNSLIHPHFGYADIIYDACNWTCKNKLQVHQNAALRAIKNVFQYTTAT